MKSKKEIERTLKENKGAIIFYLEIALITYLVVKM